jgi:hypothetical protein
MKKYLLVLFTLAIISTSCKEAYDKQAVDETLTSFLEAMKSPADFDKMKESYVGFSFHSVPSVSKYTIKSIKVENGDVIAEIATTYRKIARVSSADFILKLNEVDGAWKITNSKGMSNYKMMFPTEYKYAVDNKLIDESEELWDVELGKIIKKEDK